MKIDGSAIRPGNIIEHQGKLWRAVKTQHVKPGKGGAFLQVELREVNGSVKLKERFRSSEPVERVRLDQKEHQYLYSEGSAHSFMDLATFDQIALETDLIGESQVPFLQEGMTVVVEFHEEVPLGVTLPEKVTLAVTEADAVVKGQTASSSYKPAVLENGARIMVPPHIEAGTRVVVATADGTYVERARD